jgi:lipid-A-disaccharide synthase
MPLMGQRVFITVAEVSGDQHAGHLAEHLRELDPRLVIEGHGGPEMAEAGVVIHQETTKRAAMAYQAAARAGEMWKLFRWTRKYFDQNRPDLQICVDSPAMNFHFAKIAHERGIPVLYYIAPQLWAWREGRMKKLRKWVDQVACILPFEEAYFRKHGINATFVGHPLFDDLPPGRGPQQGPRFPERAPVIGLLPGSRKAEAQANFPAMLDVAKKIREEFPKITFLVPTTPATTPIVARMAGEFNRQMEEARPPLPTATIGGDYGPRGTMLRYGEQEFDQMVPQCDLCLTVSGTATLHVAGYGVPMIVVYRGSPILWHLVARWLVKTRTFSLVNLLNDSRETIVPEYVPWYGSTRPVADLALDYLRHPQKLAEQRERLNRLVKKLDHPGASMNVARIALSMMDQKEKTIQPQVVGGKL